MLGAFFVGGAVAIGIGAALVARDRKLTFYYLWRSMHRGARERLSPLREALFSCPGLALGATVLEIGPGLGDGIPELVSRSTGGSQQAGSGLQRLYLVEPNPYFHGPLRSAAAAAGLRVTDAKAGDSEGGQGRSSSHGASGSSASGGAAEATVLGHGAESIPEVPSGSVDTVVSHLVLCSVPSQQRVLREIHRVLRPGGRLLFVEHVKAGPESGAGARMQQALIANTGLWSFLGDGCHVDRETAEAILEMGVGARGKEQGGGEGSVDGASGRGSGADGGGGSGAPAWASVHVNRVLVPGMISGLQPHISGVAVKA
jgi:SAM-dependent methyltransferase